MDCNYCQTCSHCYSLECYIFPCPKGFADPPAKEFYSKFLLQVEYEDEDGDLSSEIYPLIRAITNADLDILGRVNPSCSALKFYPSESKQRIRAKVIPNKRHINLPT